MSDDNHNVKLSASNCCWLWMTGFLCAMWCAAGIVVYECAYVDNLRREYRDLKEDLASENLARYELNRVTGEIEFTLDNERIRQMRLLWSTKKDMLTGCSDDCPFHSRTSRNAQ